MLETLAFAAAASSGLLIGSVVGAFWDAPAGFVATALAFAAGSLTAALAFELFAEEKHENLLLAAVGLVAGGAVFIFIDAAVERRWPREKATGFALLTVVTLDGVPENLALGVTLAAEGSIALLAAIFFSNLAESLGGSADMRRGGDSPRRAILLWVATGVLLALAIVVGRVVGTPGGAQGFLLAFAGGAVLASLAATVMPEAYREGGPFVAFATIGGFLLSFLLAASE